MNRQTAQQFAGTTGQTTYLSLLIRQDALGGQFGGFAGLYVGNSTSESDPKLFVGKGGSSNNWLIENLGGTGTVQLNVGINLDETSLLVVKMKTLAGNDRFTLFVNPTRTTELQSGFVKTDLNLSIANRITLYSTGAFSFDEIRIGTTFADVITAIPEPNSALLISIGISLILSGRRRVADGGL